MKILKEDFHKLFFGLLIEYGVQLHINHINVNLKN